MSKIERPNIFFCFRTPPKRWNETELTPLQRLKRKELILLEKLEQQNSQDNQEVRVIFFKTSIDLWQQ